MRNQINADHNIAGHEALGAHVRSVVESALRRNSDHITGEDVHVSDVNSYR